MSHLTEPRPVKAISAIFSSNIDILNAAALRFEKIVGPLDYIGPELPFDQTDYYREEMGWPLVNRLFSATDLIEWGRLVDIKHQCMEVEKEFAQDGRRTVNLDPGIVSAERLVLATGKEAFHRIYLGLGVWADLTLVYKFGRFEALPWTYPNYQTPSMLAILTDIRNRYLEQLKAGRA